MKPEIDIALLLQGHVKTLARAITQVENNTEEGKALLAQLPFDREVPVLGITGPPGAGKSSLVNSLITHLLREGKKIGVLAVDPTSPFNFGSLLGDRIRLSEHFLNDQVYIRSLATRGSLGGLSAKIYEITDVMKHAGFDVILVETVGVGQSEVEIAGLADTTVVVLVPEAGDEVQTLKSGLMEIADIFVVNKADREGAESFLKNLRALAHQKAAGELTVLKTIATSGEGIPQLWEAVLKQRASSGHQERKTFLMAEKAWQLLVQQRMADVDKTKLLELIKAEANKNGFNLYKFLHKTYPQ